MRARSMTREKKACPCARDNRLSSRAKVASELLPLVNNLIKNGDTRRRSFCAVTDSHLAPPRYSMWTLIEVPAAE